MRYARIAGGVAAEVVILPDDVQLEDAFHPDIAATFTPVTEADEVAEGWRFDGAAFTAPPARPAIPLAAIKAGLKGSVDLRAENERLRYITGGTGQAMTYQAKVEEARAVLGRQDPDAADYPLLSAEVGITAATLAGVANVVLAMYRQWLVIGGAIETVRLGAKAAIGAAGTEAEARAVAAAVAWPNPLGMA